jgi:hypothetical protein
MFLWIGRIGRLFGFDGATIAAAVLERGQGDVIEVGGKVGKVVP